MMQDAPTFPEKLLKRLQDAEIEFVVIGGVAALIHGVTYTTDDVDVCIPFDQATLFKLTTAFSDLHPIHRLAANRLPLEISDKNWSMFKNIYLTTDFGIIDLLGEVAGLGNFEKILEASEISETPLGRFRVLTLDALIQAKDAAGRDKDRMVARQLRIIKSKKLKAS